MYVYGVHSRATSMDKLPAFHSVLLRLGKDPVVHIVEVNAVDRPLRFTALLELEDVRNSVNLLRPHNIAVECAGHIAVVAAVADRFSNNEHHYFVCVVVLIDDLYLEAVHQGYVTAGVLREVDDYLPALAHSND